MNNFYHQLKFYVWISKNPSKELSQPPELQAISNSTLLRWKKAFKKDRFMDIIFEVISDTSIRQKIIQAIQQQAFEGNIQAAKIVLSELPEEKANGKFVGITVDDALKIIREYLG